MLLPKCVGNKIHFNSLGYHQSRYFKFILFNIWITIVIMWVIRFIVVANISHSPCCAREPRHVVLLNRQLLNPALSIRLVVDSSYFFARNNEAMNHNRCSSISNEWTTTNIPLFHLVSHSKEEGDASRQRIGYRVCRNSFFGWWLLRPLRAGVWKSGIESDSRFNSWFPCTSPTAQMLAGWDCV